MRIRESSVLTLNFTRKKACHLRREWLEVKSCVLFLVLSFFSGLISSSTRTEIGLDYIISEATTSSLVSLTFQGQANTCEWSNSVPYLEYKRKIFLSLLVSSGKWLLFSS